MVLDELQKLSGYAWHGRLMFGTDLPVWQVHDDCGLTKRYRECARAFRATGLEAESDVAFRSFFQRSGKLGFWSEFS